MRLKFNQAATYKQCIKEPGPDFGKIDPNSPKYEAGKVYEVSEAFGYANRWLRRGVAVEVVEPVTTEKRAPTAAAKDK